MQKIFIDKNDFSDLIKLSDDKSKHLSKVLRMKIGDEIIVISNNEKYLFNIISFKPCLIKKNKKLELSTSNAFELNAIFAAIKTKNLELAVKKAVELNVNNFYIFYFNYSQGNEKYNLERLKNIIISATEQSNRDSLMNLEIIGENKLKNILNSNDINFIAHFSNNNSHIINKIKQRHKKISLIIGPEGGFSEEDLSLLSNKNSCIINLTKTILRSETALFYGLSIINEFKLGE